MSTHTGGVRVRQVADFFWVGALGYLARARALTYRSELPTNAGR